MNKFNVCSGFHSKGDGSAETFFYTWFENTMKHAQPHKVIVIADSGAKIPHWRENWKAELVPLELEGNLGHFMDLVNGQKPHQFNGWSGVILAGAMLCYCDEADMVFKEADCLWFGDCVGRMYSEIGSAAAVWGHCSFMPCEQSLFLVKHAAIPEFVREYLDGPAQNTEQELGEHKFLRMERHHPGIYKRHSLGPGRDRPLTYEAEAWAAQKFSAEELEELRNRGLI